MDTVSQATGQFDLLVFAHGIGDTVMFSGVAREYAQAQGLAGVDVCVSYAGAAEVLQGHPWVRHIHSVTFPRHPKFWNPPIYWAMDYWNIRDVVRPFCQANAYRRVRVVRVQGMPEFVYQGLGNYGPHKVNRIARELGVTSPNLFPELVLAPADLQQAQALVAKHSLGRFAVLHPISGHGPKSLSDAQLMRIVDHVRELGLQSVVVGAAKDAGVVPLGHVTCTLYGLNMRVIAALLQHAQLFVGTDSSIAHLAGWANVPRLVIITPKRCPEWYTPLTQTSRITLIRKSEFDQRLAPAMMDMRDPRGAKPPRL